MRVLETLHIPVPKWQEVRYPTDISTLRFPVSEYGWTVRTCRQDGMSEMGGFFLNHATEVEVISVLKERSEEFSGQEFYLIYPSWQFSRSFNIVKSEETYDMEMVFGSQKGLAMGREDPIFSIRFFDSHFCNFKLFRGEYDNHTRRYVAKMIRYIRRIGFDRYHAEVAITTKDNIIFYDFIIF